MELPETLAMVPDGPVAVYTAPRGIPAHDVVRFMAARGARAVVVVRGRTPIGIVTARDLTERVAGAGLVPTLTRIESAMSSPLVVIGEWETIGHAVTLMHQRGISHLPIVGRGGKLLSFLTMEAVWHLQRLGVEKLSEFVQVTTIVSMVKRRWLARIAYHVRHWIRENRTWFLLALGAALLIAAVALIAGWYWRGFQAYLPHHYEPKDIQRQDYMDQLEQAKPKDTQKQAESGSAPTPFKP